MGAGGGLVSGAVFAIGGHEAKEGERAVLKAVADSLPHRRLAIATVASEVPDQVFQGYVDAFADLGAGELVHVHVDERGQAADASAIEGAGGVFFTGGDQLRITSLLGDTALERAMLELWEDGGTIAGTSAGASVLSATMIVRGDSRQSSRIGDLQMAPGLAIVRELVIDQHFGERGRIGRLVAAVTQNPRLLGLGIDEDTAIRVDGSTFEVLGTGAVTVLDAARVTSSNVAEGRPESTLTVHDLCGHVLAAGDRFDIEGRRPL